LSKLKSYELVHSCKTNAGFLMSLCLVRKSWAYI